MLREIRNEMYAAGMNVESAKGECNFGQHEIGFLFDGVLRTCDNHSVYKTGAKEIAARHGQSLTFMAKFDEREGNSCHIHLSLRGTDGEVVFADDDRDGGRSELFDQFMAGLLATMRELTYFYAPNINSYKRFAAGSFAPTAVAWGTDNRTCALRVVGHGAGLRVENRLPGGDVNPYLAVAAMMAGGLHGIREGLELPPVCEGNAYVGDYEHVPSHPGRGTRPPGGQRHRPPGLRRRGRRPLRQRRGRRARGIQLRGDRLGARPRLREAVTTPTMSTTYAHDVVNPATEQVVTTVELVGLEETDAAIARAVEVGPAWRAVSPADRGMLLRRFADVGRGLHRRAGGPGGRQLGPHRRQRPVGGRQRRRRAALLLGRTGTPLRPADPGRGRARRHLQGAARRRLGHRAVELPDADRGLGARAGPGRRATPSCSSRPS